MKALTYIQQRYRIACMIQDGTAYTQGRMAGVAIVARTMGYTGDDLSIRLQLLTEVLATK